MNLIEKMADAIHHRDSTDCMAISRVAAKVMLDDMREWLFRRRYDEQDCEIGEFQYYDVLSQIDAYEKERLND